MVVSFPHMGPLTVALSSLLSGCGVAVCAPQPTSKATLEIGARYAPETACLPFKVGLGNFVQALEKGADILVTCGGEGPCRLGYYAEIQKNILRDLGYDFEMIVVEPTLPSAWGAFRRLVRPKNWPSAPAAFRLAGAKMAALDVVERETCHLRPRAREIGQVETLRRQAVVRIDQAVDLPGVAAAKTLFFQQALAIQSERAEDPVKVGLVGEIFVTLDSYINQNVIAKLGALGVEVFPAMLLSDYYSAHIIHSRQAVGELALLLRAAQPFLGLPVGGHGTRNIGAAVIFGQRGFDGLVHVLPFACMPEVIAGQILPTVSDTVGLPVLSLTFDEQTAEAGVVTRLEAFVDLLNSRRKKPNR